MLWEIVRQDKYLTLLIAVVAALWLFVFFRNMWVINKSTGDFQRQYEQILNADEYKVKGKYEQ